MKHLKYKIGLWVSVALCVGFTGLFFMIVQSANQTTETTTLYEGTVTEVEVKESCVDIYTVEYEMRLHISQGVADEIKQNGAYRIEPGEKILFRVENQCVDSLQTGPFVPIVSLETEADVILSLEDYNRFMSAGTVPIKVLTLLAVTSFLAGAILCGFKLLKARKRNT